jgi:hypothetical protein
MDYNFIQIILILLILGVSGLAQSAIGFGYALFAIPPLIWIGVPLPSAIAMVCACSTVQTVLASRRLHKEIPWTLVYKTVAVRFVFVIIGLFFLKLLVNQSSIQIKGIVGGILCLLVFIQLLWRPKPVDAMHMGWGILSWAASGLLSGICGMGGPPLVLWAMAHTWSTEKTRGFLFAVFAMTTPLQLVLLCITFGMEIFWSIGLGILFSPVVYMGYRIGLPLGSRINKGKLRFVALIILFFIGAAALVQVFIR